MSGTREPDWTPFIIGVAPNGARRTKEDHPAIPLTADEIAHEAARCRDAGAAYIHVHVRDRDGAHTLDPDAYRDAIAALRREVGDTLVVQITSEAVGKFSRAEQMASVRAVRPEAVSLAVREIVPDAGSEAEAAEFFAWLDREKVMAQYILYDVPDLQRFRDLRMRGVVTTAVPFVLFVLGRYAKGQRSKPADLLPFLDEWRDEAPWAVCAFGPLESACALTAATLGGHSRVGFENNIHLGDGSLAPDNAALIAQDRAGAELIGRPIATAADMRAMFAERVR